MNIMNAMNAMKSCLFFLMFVCTIFFGYSQSNKNMVDSITAQTPDKGTINIYSESGITNLIGKINTSGVVIKPNMVIKRGFRVQVYSGSQKQASKDEAYSREQKVKSKYPEYGAYVSFDSPFWKLRVGDFLDRRDAEDALKELKKGLPEYASEMYVAPDNVRVPE